MKNININFIIKTTLTAAFLLAVGAAVSFGAWTDPTDPPPGGNISAPVNVGSISQSKVGPVILNTGGAPVGLSVPKGNVGIGTLIPSSLLTLDNGDLSILDSVGAAGNGRNNYGLWWDTNEDTGVETVLTSGVGGFSYNALVLKAGGNSVIGIGQDYVTVNGTISADNILPIAYSTASGKPTSQCDSSGGLEGSGVGNIIIQDNGDMWICSDFGNLQSGPDIDWRLMSSARKVCRAIKPGNGFNVSGTIDSISVSASWTRSDCATYAQSVGAVITENMSFQLGCINENGVSVGQINGGTQKARPNPNCGW